MSSSISLSAVSRRQPSLLQPARQQNQASLYDLPNEALQIIGEDCYQTGTQHLRNLSLVSGFFYQLTDQVKSLHIRRLNSQISQFLFSDEAESLFNADSLNKLQSIFQNSEKLQGIFQIIHAVADDSQMRQCQPLLSKLSQFLFSEEAQACFEEGALKEVESVFQGMCEKIQKRDTVQAILHKNALQKILRTEFEKIVEKGIVNQNNFPLIRLIKTCQRIKRGDFLEAIKILSARPLPIYKAGRAVYGVNLTRGDLVTMSLCAPEDFGEGASLTEQIKGELGLFFLTYISSFFTQERKPNFEEFFGLAPKDAWKGVLEIYKEKGSLLAVQILLASKVDILVDDEAAHWAIENNAKDLLEILLENDFNPNKLNKAGESALYCAMKVDRSDMVNMLLEHKADVSHLLKREGDIDPLQWAILNNNEKLLKALLALDLDQNELAQALTYAEEMKLSNMVNILRDHNKDLEIENKLSASVETHLALC